MTITLDPKLEAALCEAAMKWGVTPEYLAINTLQWRFMEEEMRKPRDEWERGLIAAARDWGVSFTNEQLSSEGLYD
jgi:hypothetical protein